VTEGVTAAVTAAASDGGRPPFRRVLVANRGEIAVRIIRACRELGIESVAVYSDADADALHTRAADERVRIGPAPAADSYLRVDAIIAAARDTGADAIHPGYGFLSERPELAEACQVAAIAFVGPAPATLRALGDKLAARAAAAQAGVPIVPGMLEPAAADSDREREDLLRQADRIGWPVLVKAAAGGGGRGMRRVDTAAELPEALASAAGEAAAAFGNGQVYLERFVERARHVEVQLLGDDRGSIVALGERDCSIQRRHQKLVEESPAPGLTADRRIALHALGVAVAATVGLRNAATAEFLLTPDGEFWFLEVNARLQVEHGVTELLTDIDLVHEQLRIAAGEPLSERVLATAATAHRPARHAIEVRLSAEDPSTGFAPAPGRIGRWRAPAGPGVRVDSGVGEGSSVSSDYDPLLAKLMVVAGDRPSALARLGRALDEFEVGGVQTTLPFHRWLLGEPAFATGADLSTNLVDRLWDPAPLVSRAALRAAELAARADVEHPPHSAAASVGQPPTPPVDDPAGAWWGAGIGEATERRP
jgi:acetyl/propionyl-CoA carboxylase alpha subunit